MKGKRAGAIYGSYEGMIRQLEDELREYDELRSGELTPNVERLNQIRRKDADCKGSLPS